MKIRNKNIKYCLICGVRFDLEDPPHPPRLAGIVILTATWGYYEIRKPHGAGKKKILKIVGDVSWVLYEVGIAFVLV